MGDSTPPRTGPALARWIALRYPRVRSITTAELALRLAPGVVDAPILVDVRRDDERAVSAISSALGVRDADEAVALLGAVDRSLPVVVYCAVGVRSARAAMALSHAGHRDVRNLAGGIFAWANEARPLVVDGRPATLVHPYDRRWGRLLHRNLRAPIDADR